MAEKAEKAEKKGNFFVKAGGSLRRFLRETKGEAKKIVWPTPQSVMKSTGVVLATIVVIGAFVFGLDTLLINLLGLIMNVAK